MALRRHRLADVWHRPKFAGEVFLHQARFTAQSFDCPVLINTRWPAAQFFGKEYLFLFQHVKSCWIMRREQKPAGAIWVT